jgi:hypothetical protein
MLKSSDETNKELLEELDMILDNFTMEEIGENPADYWLNQGKAILDALSASASTSSE